MTALDLFAGAGGAALGHIVDELSRRFAFTGLWRLDAADFDVPQRRDRPAVEAVEPVRPHSEAVERHPHRSAAAGCARGPGDGSKGGVMRTLTDYKTVAGQDAGVARTHAWMWRPFSLNATLFDPPTPSSPPMKNTATCSAGATNVGWPTSDSRSSPNRPRRTSDTLTAIRHCSPSGVMVTARRHDGARAQGTFAVCSVPGVTPWKVTHASWPLGGETWRSTSMANAGAMSARRGIMVTILPCRSTRARRSCG